MDEVIPKYFGKFFYPSIVMDRYRLARDLVATDPQAAFDMLLGRTTPRDVARNHPKVAYDLILARGQGTSMGAWDGEEYFWPEPVEFDLYPDRSDRFGDYYDVTYQYIADDLDLIVSMDATPYINSNGSKPGKFEANYHGSETRGTWRDIKDIPNVLRKLIGQARKAREKVERELLQVGGSKWDTSYDWGQLIANYKNTDRYSDAYMTVTFQDVDDVIFGDMKASEADIDFAAGADYEGAYGQRAERKTFRSLKDIRDILNTAEKLWKRWTSSAA